MIIVSIVAFIIVTWAFSVISQKNVLIQHLESRTRNDQMEAFLNKQAYLAKYPNLVFLDSEDNESMAKQEDFPVGTYFIYHANPTARSTDSDKYPLRMVRKIRDEVNPALSKMTLIGRIVTLESRKKYLSNDYPN